MAYPFRAGNPQGAAEAADDSRPSTNHQNHAGNNDGRGGLTRRFTMNALPTLSPIGQQRRQAAGDLSMVSTHRFFSVGGRWVAEISDLGSGSGTDEAAWDMSLPRQDANNIWRHKVEAFVSAESAARMTSAHGAEDERRRSSSAFLPALEEWTFDLAGAEMTRKIECRDQGALSSMLTSYKQPAGGFGRTVSSHLHGRCLKRCKADVRQTVVACCHVSRGARALAHLARLDNADCCQVDRRSRQIEDVIQLQRRLNAQMEQLDADAQREIEASIRHETAVNKLMAQSEPTTPPEYQDAFPSR